MSTFKEYRKSEIVTGIFVILALFIFGLFAFRVGGFDFMGLVKPPAISAQTAFLDVKSLRVGAEVKVGGRQVGEVVELNLVDRRWPIGGEPAEGEASHRLVNEVIFELYDPSLRIEPRSAAVSISQDSPLAPHFLTLDPGRWPSGQAPPTIFEDDIAEPLELPGEEALDFTDLLAMAQPAILELREILETLNRDVLTEENMGDLGAIVDEIGGMTASSREMLDRLNSDVLSTENVATLNRTLAEFEQVVAEGRRVAGRLDSLLDPEQDPRLDQILTDVAEITGRLDQDLEKIQSDLDRLIATAETTLDDSSTEVTEALRRLQRALWQGEMALRKIRANPAVLLFGDDETDLEARDADQTQMRLEGRARPYEQRDERDDQR